MCLIDISMPEMDGYETMAQLQRKYPYIKGLVLTTMSNEYAILKMLQHGACGYVMKNQDCQSLKTAITDTYIQGFYYCNTVREKLPGITGSKREEYFKNMFTIQELNFLKLCCSDMKYDEIAKQMNISTKTVEHVAERVAEKTGLHQRYQLAMYSLHVGIGSFRVGRNKL